VFLGGRRLDDVADWTVDGDSKEAWLGFSGCFVRPDPKGFGSVFVGSKHDSRGLIQAGAVQRYALGRWIVQPPRAADRWAAGARGALRWIGATRADVDLSTDGGRTWVSVAHGVGGSPHNVLQVPIPPDAHGEMLARLRAGAKDSWGETTHRIPVGPRP
jgi:hypothetical protein